jgi:hypothetical protein
MRMFNKKQVSRRSFIARLSLSFHFLASFSAFLLALLFLELRDDSNPPSSDSSRSLNDFLHVQKQNKTLTKTNTTSIYEEKRDKMLRDHRYLSKLRKAYNIESSSSSSYNS